MSKEKKREKKRWYVSSKTVYDLLIHSYIPWSIHSFSFVSISYLVLFCLPQSTYKYSLAKTTLIMGFCLFVWVCFKRHFRFSLYICVLFLDSCLTG